MDKYTGKSVDGTLIVGQVWHDGSNGEPDMTILEIGEKLSTKGRCQMGASHDYLHSKVKAITQTGDNAEQEHWDAENLLDYLECNCYEPVEDNYAVTHGAAIVLDEFDPINWPNGNAPGNCWCGHMEGEHSILNVEGRCTGCQCVGYVEDKWVNNNG